MTLLYIASPHTWTCTTLHDHLPSPHPHQERCLYNCTRSITKQATNLKMEKAHFADTLQQNGYPAAFVRAASIETTPRELNRERKQGEGKPTLMMLPHVAGISERIKKVFWSILTKVKNPLPVEKQANVVYEVPCSCGKVYIGETKWHLET